ncbi:MAG: carbamoyltransferase HypF [Parvularcula sp.]|nr:carbamoyltransferase HypF [Parvularcula sp.]
MTEVQPGGELIVVRGQVQGVGFRPTIWRLAKELGLAGDVSNTAEGVRIRLWGDKISSFVERLQTEAPPLARIQQLERQCVGGVAPDGFEIAETRDGAMRVAVTPDAATCADCLREINDPFDHRYRYPFANCTNCGPRFSIIHSAPYDRAKTSMKAFDLCHVCRGEYEDPGDRRYHAQPVACHACGPRAWIEKLGQGVVNCEAFSMMDDVDAVGGMLMSGKIVAIKGLGGFHLACDATNAESVERLRARKRRRDKAFALMARDIAAISAYAHVTPEDEAALKGPAAPIVLLKTRADAPLPEAVAPGLNRLGFMLPYTPLHHLMLKRMTRPVVMTSGNVSGEPQCFKNEEAREKLTAVADFACMTDRDIVNRIDDSVVRIDLGEPRLVRRARGYAPAAIDLPPGLEGAPDIRAYGADLKNAFCITKDGGAILSQHMGDLDDPATADDLVRNLSLYQNLFEHDPEIIAVDQHPEYRSSKLGRELAKQLDRPLIEVQHHHAHIASCLAENAWPGDGGKVLGVALDGAGWGADATIWGGEFLACDYASFERLATFKPVPLLGGDAAAREPWRNAYAHLMAEMGWAEFAMNFSELEMFRYLNDKPRETLDAMIAAGVNAPLASSCGRLFDAAAAILGLARDQQSYEGHAAMLLEAAIDPKAMEEGEDLAYPFSIPLMGGQGLPYVEPVAVWRAMLGDLILETPIGVIAARFHRGLARVIIAMVDRLMGDERVYHAVALSGGCFQNKTLFELVHTGLEARGHKVLSHREVPANDGGIALGQAAIAAANYLKHKKGSAPCA